jgi:hypothetical protein
MRVLALTAALASLAALPVFAGLEDAKVSKALNAKNFDSVVSGKNAFTAFFAPCAFSFPLLSRLHVPTSVLFDSHSVNICLGCGVSDNEASIQALHVD